MVAWKSLIVLRPRNLVYVSDSSPVILSSLVRRYTPELRPMCRNNSGLMDKGPFIAMMLSAEGAAVSACIDLLSSVESGSKLRVRTVQSSHPTASVGLRTRPSGTGPKLRHVTMLDISFFSPYSASDLSLSTSKYTSTPELKEIASCRSFVATATIYRCSGTYHSLISPPRICRMPRE